MQKIQNRPMPSRHAVGFIAAVTTSIIITLAVSVMQIVFTWTPFQRYHLPDLGVYAIAKVLHLPTTEHRFIGIALGNGKTDLARDADFIPGHVKGIDGMQFPFAPSSSAVEHGRTRIFRSKAAAYDTNKLGQWFQVVVFPDLTPTQFALLPCTSGLIALIFGLWLALPFDRERARIRRFGRRLRGPEFVDTREFVRRLGADGIGFLTRAQGIWNWLTDKKYVSLQIPLSSEASGIGILGATGSGKSAVTFQIVAQAIARGERVVVVDPAFEFTERFMDACHTLLNSWDRRTAAWDLKAETSSSAEARTVACSMLPHRKNEQPFFVEAAQRVLAELLKHRPSAQELAAWLADPAEVDRRLIGTEAARMIDPHAGPQRVGVLATLAMFGEALRSICATGWARFGPPMRMRPWSAAFRLAT
ncbi:MAG: type IV secretion system DNA-binding domain-containing protein [Terracidiphilus sp.]